MHQPVRELAVVGEEQQPRAIDVQAPHRDPSPGRQAGEHGWPAFRIAAGNELAFRLVVYEDAPGGFRPQSDRDAVDRNLLSVTRTVAQLGDAPAPYASAIPQGTPLRALFIGERGEAFVDLGGEVRTKHPGGSLEEIFTAYAIVNALTVNLPAITRVQILIDGKEVDTLAGHVDLRHPLQKSLKWTALQTDNDK